MNSSPTRSSLLVRLPRMAGWQIALYLLALWILVWSLARVLGVSLAATGGGSAVPVTPWPLPLAIGLLTAAWLAAGFLFLFYGRQLAASVAALGKRSPAVRRSVWLVPGLLWAAAFLLHRLAAASDPSMADGPALVLLSWGLVLFLYLLKQAQPGARETSLPLGENSAAHRRPGWLASRKGRAAAKLGPVLVVTAVPLLLFAGTLFDRQVVVYGQDLFVLHYMFEGFVREALGAGRLPLWNPYIFSGSPALGHPQYLVFYPPQMLLRLLPLNLAISWAVALHVWLAGMGMLVLGRRLRLRPWIALTCALATMLNSGLLVRVYAGHVWLVYALAWFPLVWVLMMNSLETGHPMAMVGAAVGLALMLLTGHPTFPLYFLLFFALYCLYVCHGLWRKGAAWKELGAVTMRFLIPVVAALGLSAIQIGPSLVVARQVSVGSGYDLGRANALALSVGDLLGAVIPAHYQDPMKWALYWEEVPYLGILFLLLLPMACGVRGRASLARFLSGVVVLSLAISFGNAVGVFSVLYRILPGFSVARIPPRAFVMAIPAVVLLGGLALEALSTRAADTRTVTRGTRVYFGCSSLVLGGALGSWLSTNYDFADGLSPATLASLLVFIVSLALVLFPVLCVTLLPRAKNRLQELTSFGTMAVIGCLVGALWVPSEPITINLFVLALLIGTNTLLITYLHRYGSAAFVVLSLMAVLCFDLGVFSFPHIIAEPSPTFFENERVVLQDADTGSQERVMSLTGFPNQYMLGHVSNVDGYNTGILAGYDAFLRGVSRNPSFSTSRLLAEDTTVDLRALDFLGVRYIVSGERLDESRLQLATVQDQFYLYSNPGALPRAFMVYDLQVVDTDGAALERLAAAGFDYARSAVVSQEPGLEAKPGGEARVSIGRQEPASGDLSMTVWTSEPGLLVTSEPYFSERRVWVDNEPAELIRANVAFSAVPLPAGSHSVEIRYVPASLAIGGAITALTMLACLCAAVCPGISRARARGRG